MFREKMHKIADDLVDNLAPALLDEKPMTMQEISAVIEEKKQEFLGHLVT